MTTTTPAPAHPANSADAVPASSGVSTGNLSGWGAAVWALASREVVRFLRQRTRVVGALLQPLIFWVLFGAGLHSSFQPPDWAPQTLTYQQYFFPGIIVLIVLFTAIFSTISMIEDRKEGFLQGVLAAPIARSALVFGKLTGGVILALIQAGLFLGLAPVLHNAGLLPPIVANLGGLDWLGVIGFLVLLAYSLTALGYLIAWPMESTQGFHAIMSLVLMPMWLLSGAFFPADSSGILSWMMALNPLTYGTIAMQRMLLPGISAAAQPGLPSLGFCFLITLGVTAFYCGLSVWMTSRSSVRNVR